MNWTARIGLLRLTDAASVILATESGMFARHGGAVTLSVEPSWANIADKLAYGLLDAAVILPPLAIAASLGLRGLRTQLVVPMGLSQGGNTVVLSNAAARAVARRQRGDDIAARGRAVADWVKAADNRPRLGVVHLFSGQHLLLRYWLAASGVDCQADVDFVVLPPAEMPAALTAGRLDGFCAGAPWGTLVAQQGMGQVIAGTSEIWRQHPEKMLAVRRDWAEAEPTRLTALTQALMASARFCDDPAHADALAEMLAGSRYLGVSKQIIRASLAGAAASAQADLIRFEDAAVPRPAQAAWFAGQMERWGWLPEASVSDATELFRPDLGACEETGQRPDDRFFDSP